MRRRTVLGLGLALAAGIPLVRRLAFADTTVTFQPDTRYQTFRAWEATPEVFWTEEYSPHRAEIYDRLISELGITRLRLEVWSGAENTDRSFERFQSGDIDMQGWRARRYATVNDDADPFHINWAGFDFANLDWRIEQHLLPIRDRARAHGQELDILFTYVAFTNQIRDGAYIHTDAEEYAEFILACFLHMQDKYGIVPGSFEPLLEPDMVKEWTPELLGRAIAAATRRLADAGFHPRIVLPSVTDIHNMLPWLDGIAAVPGAMTGVAELSYHRYHGGWPIILQKIAARAKAIGAETSMLEYWGGKATYRVLHEDLTYAEVSAWQARSVLAHYRIDPRRPEGKQVVLNEDIRYDRLYFTAIRPGAVRIGATSSTPTAADPLAFVNPDGTMAVVLRADKAVQVTLEGLPEGDYLLETAFKGGGLAPLPCPVDATGRLTARIPAPGVISLRPKRP